MRILDRTTYEGSAVYQIETVVGGLVGWITPGFIGRAFPRESCRTFFTEADHIERCEG